MRVFMWSDLHLLHTNIIEYQQRPFEKSFKGALKNARVMFENYINTVKKDDIVLFVGDLALVSNRNKKFVKKFVQALPGNKFLILGNHDRKDKEFYLNCGFIDVFDYMIIGQNFICHYPLNEYINKSIPLLDIFYENKCKVLYHGHTHNSTFEVNDKIQRINVCVDYNKNNYKPIKITNKVIKTYLKNLLKTYL